MVVFCFDVLGSCLRSFAVILSWRSAMMEHASVRAYLLCACAFCHSYCLRSVCVNAGPQWAHTLCLVESDQCWILMVSTDAAVGAPNFRVLLIFFAWGLPFHASFPLAKALWSNSSAKKPTVLQPRVWGPQAWAQRFLGEGCKMCPSPVGKAALHWQEHSTFDTLAAVFFLFLFFWMGFPLPFAFFFFFSQVPSIGSTMNYLGDALNKGARASEDLKKISGDMKKNFQKLGFPSSLGVNFGNMGKKGGTG